MARKLPLTTGGYAFVDDEDYAACVWFSVTWFETSHGYARADKGRCTKYLHVFVYERAFGPVPAGMEVDHENRNKLDCTRRNLRPATSQQNKRNRPQPRGVTGYLGVSTVRTGTFRAHITVDEKQRHLGTFATVHEAAYARDLSARELFGEFAILNGVSPVELRPVSNRVAGASGLVGVKKHKNKWIARVKRNGVEHHLGVFDTPEEAAREREAWLTRA